MKKDKIISWWDLKEKDREINNNITNKLSTLVEMFKRAWNWLLVIDRCFELQKIRFFVSKSHEDDILIFGDKTFKNLIFKRELWQSQLIYLIISLSTTMEVSKDIW